MNITYVYPEPLPDRKARAISVLNTVRALSRSTPTTLIYEKSPAKAQIESKENLTVAPLGKSLMGIRSNKIFNYHLRRYLSRQNPDFLYLRHLKTAAYLLKHYRGPAKILFECHEIFSETNPDIRALEEFVYEHSDGLIFINQTLQREIETAFDISQIPARVIDNGCSFNLPFLSKDFSDLRSLVYIGNFYPWKGVDLLIDAMQYLPDMRLEIIGDGERREVLEAKIREQGLDRRVTLHGYRPHNEVVEILRDALLTVIPNTVSAYTRFSTPIKLYEYMAASTIVLSSDMPTVREIVEDGVNGFLFTTGDPRDLARTVEKIRALAPETLSRIAYAAYQTSKNYTWEARGRKITEFLKSLSNEPTT